MSTSAQLRIRIHRGTREIGGTCVELEAEGERLVLDLGLPLDANDPDSVPLPEIKGFSAPDNGGSNRCQWMNCLYLLQRGLICPCKLLLAF
jgi:hypothetical protein